MNNDTLIADTPRDMKLYTLLSMKQTLKLECVGIKFKGGSVYAHIKRTYGFTGNKHSVLAQFTDYIKSQY